MFTIAGGVILGGFGLIILLFLLPLIMDAAVCLLRILTDPLEQVKGFRLFVRYAFTVVLIATAVILIDVLHL